ncbi:hypothetical protein OUZ56_002640 [Daphnia magna]|uniref:Uncharacterized protein n=1 Tax=Daphnia magna TaxID=35525 RepID=A0ABR0A6D0_9CRUS|nr:hypothetical protein OUZ56_002640 [Daphnia magna]
MFVGVDLQKPMNSTTRLRSNRPALTNSVRGGFHMLEKAIVGSYAVLAVSLVHFANQASARFTENVRHAPGRFSFWSFLLYLLPFRVMPMLWQPSVAQHVGLALADMTVDVALFGFRHLLCACNVSKITSSDTLHLPAYRRRLWFDVWHQLDHRFEYIYICIQNGDDRHVKKTLKRCNGGNLKLIRN